MRTRWTKWLRLALPGCAVLQITACFGSDPELFFTTSVANALVFNIVNTLFDLVINTLTATPAILLG